MRHSILLLLLLQALPGAAQHEGVVRKYSGSIGKISIVADIKIIDSSFSGSYYYVKEGNTARLKGTFTRGALPDKSFDVTANEEVNDSITGSITGKLSEDYATFKGTWQNIAKDKSNPVEWKMIQRDGSAGLKVISKQYSYVWKKNKNGNELGCKSFYSLCYISQLPDLEVKKLMNEGLIQADLDADASDDDLKEAAIEFLNDDFYFYKEDFDTAFAGANTAENEQWMNESPQLYQWKRSQTCDVLFNENNLLVLQIFEDNIRGGSHESTEYINIVYDLKTGSPLELDDLLKPGFRNQLNELAKTRLLSKFKAGSLQQLEENGFQLHGSFSANDNFFIQKNGIGFTYSPNEIAPYSKGAITIIIPWSSLQQLINPSGTLAWAIKK